jgi:hypothetical protein
VTESVVFSGFADDQHGSALEQLVLEFCDLFEPLERSRIVILTDDLTGAAYTECHIRASVMVNNGTTNVPLDPDESPEYRANRDIVTSHSAFERMQNDAIGGRKFSDIVCEYSPNEVEKLQIIGGQHRFEAISGAFHEGVNVHHGLKVYFDLDKEQRLDVQVISNTNISVPTDLLDRMFATMEGADLRNWCQKCRLLESGQDFADKSKAGSPITVKEARTFIINYFSGKSIDPKKFELLETTPKVVETGKRDPALWKQTLTTHPDLWQDGALIEAGRQFANLIVAQREYFRDPSSSKLKGRSDQIYKTKNIALLAGWAFVAGVLHQNEKRLKSHYALKEPKSKDPLKAELLAKGKHSTDPESYRGLGFRSDPKERGRFTELFWLQAETGGGLTAALIDTAIKGYEAKRANLVYLEGKAKL